MTKYENIPTGESMSDYGLESPRAQEMIAAARAMGPALRMRAAKAKADARVSDETVQEFHEAGFFKILQPEQWGGYAMDPQVFYAVGVEVAKACPSSAWVLTAGARIRDSTASAPGRVVNARRSSRVKAKREASHSSSRGSRA